MDDLSAVFFRTAAGVPRSDTREASMLAPRLRLKSEYSIPWDELEQSIHDRFEEIVRRYWRAHADHDQKTVSELRHPDWLA